MSSQPKTPAAAPLVEREVPFDPGMLATISKAEIDMQIATAHRFPRVVSTFLSEAEQLVTLSEYIADECIYSLPARSDGEEPIEGPSARFAEVILHAWKNSRAGARVVGEDGDFIICQGAFHDLQSNTAISYEVRRRITNRHGRRYSADMIGMTGNAGCSIALRNAILKGVPKAFWIGPYEAARKVLLGDYQTLGKRRAETLERFKKMGVPEARVLEKFGVKGIEDLSLELVFQLKTMLNAIRDGDTNVDEQFPKAPVASSRSATAGLGAAVAAAAAEAKTDSKAEAPADGGKADPKPDAPAGQAPTGDKAPGTLENRSAIEKKIRAAKSKDDADTALDSASLYDFTKVDREFLNMTYNEKVLTLG